MKAIDDAMDRAHALGALGGWASVKGPRKAKSLKNPNSNRMTTVENEQDLVKIFALPSGPQSNEARIAATQMLRVDKNLKPGEKYCMMDSSAGCNAADAKKEFGAHRVRSVKTNNNESWPTALISQARAHATSLLWSKVRSI